jgi:hypothetical protein
MSIRAPRHVSSNFRQRTLSKLERRQSAGVDTIVGVSDTFRRQLACQDREAIANIEKINSNAADSIVFVSGGVLVAPAC